MEYFWQEYYNPFVTYWSTWGCHTIEDEAWTCDNQRW